MWYQIERISSTERTGGCLRKSGAITRPCATAQNPWRMVTPPLPSPRTKTHTPRLWANARPFWGRTFLHFRARPSVHKRQQLAYLKLAECGARRAFVSFVAKFWHGHSFTNLAVLRSGGNYTVPRSPKTKSHFVADNKVA